MRIFAAIVLSALSVIVGYSQQAPSKTKSSKTITTPAKKAESSRSTADAKPRPPAAKARSGSSNAKKPDEKAEWEKATANVDAGERIKALKKFIRIFPQSEKKAEAAELISSAHSALGNEKLQAGDIAAAAAIFREAAAAAPVPIPDRLFSDALSKVPANLYFRGFRAEAMEIAKVLEAKVETRAGQLLTLAEFYMSIESGSDVKRLADKAIALEPASSAAYQSLGLANRMDFQLEASAAAYAKAIELDPSSVSARRGLAEMNRSLGKADEAAALYREILSTDANNVPAHTGLVLSLLDAGKRSDAEAEMAKALEANPSNVILLAGAAYWYAVQSEGEKAIDLAQKAIAADPRFIWSHIALARGQLSRNDPIGAEKTLLAARRYGNFPTLEYELASARLAAGFFREAAEELAKSFTIKDGVIHTKVGGRIARESKNFTELVGYERRASIFAPSAADTPENAARLTSLLELKQELDSASPRPERTAVLADDFVRGDDRMKLHRQLFAANQLLNKRVATAKVIEIAKAATANIEGGLDVPHASTAVMASELYEGRSLAAMRGEYVNVPDVQRGTLSAIVRGRVEETIGQAALESDDPAEAVIRLKRAVSILPADSAWWRTSTWRLASALHRTGKDGEALEWYIRSYKSRVPNQIDYEIIEALHRSVHGSLDGLESRIGAKPLLGPSRDTVARNVTSAPTVETTPEPKPDPTPRPTPVRSRRSVIPSSVPVATPAAVAPELAPETTPQPTPARPEVVSAKPEPTATPMEIPVLPSPSPEAPPIEPSPSPTPAAGARVPTPTPTPTDVVETAIQLPIRAVPLPTVEAVPTPSPTPAAAATPASAEAAPTPAPDASVAANRTRDLAAVPVIEEKKIEALPAETSLPRSEDAAKSLFPPVVITIPKSETAKTPLKGSGTSEETGTIAPARVVVKQFPENPPVILGTNPRPRFSEFARPWRDATEPCKLRLSEERLTIRSGGGGLAVVVDLENDGDLDDLTAMSTSPGDVSVRREIIAGVRSRALFVVSSISGKTGV
ncbi:MAG TPA: tetratricopeptide repeat protein, partial [Pyrinomonadaceae bacterium]|nr:tetratricopeptide repeat protein [Pyrinomonadaceae bacterium]